MKFKVGDWVIEPNKEISKIICPSPNGGIKLSSGKSRLKEELKLWKPKSGEWCWYGFELVQVLDVQQDNIKICRQKSDVYEEITEEQLEPFIGSLPTCTKDKE